MGKVKKNLKNLLPVASAEQGFVEAFADRVRHVRRKIGLNQTDMSKYLGRANNNAVSRLERGDAGAISFDVLEGLVRLAEGAGFTAEWLLTGMKISATLPIPELQEALNYALNWHYMLTIPHDGAPKPGELKKYAPYGIRVESEQPFRATTVYEPGYQEVDRDELPPRWRGRFLPVIGRLSAGEGVDTAEAETHPPGWADSFVAFEDAPSGAFALRVVGDSMEPDYADGDMVIVDPDRQVDSGVACVLVSEDGERRARLKILSKKGRQVFLLSTNPKHPPLKIPLKKLIAAYGIVEHLPRIIKGKK